MNNNCNRSSLLRLLMPLAFALFFIGCSGGGKTQQEITGELTVDESLSPEQQIELLKLKAKAFTDSIREEGYNVLGNELDSLFYVFYAKEDTLYNTYFRDYGINAWRLPIFCKDIKTGHIKEVSIPKTIDGRQIKINLILDYFGRDGKVIMIVTDKNPEELQPYFVQPVNVICFDSRDFTFNYIVGGRPWSIGNERIRIYDSDISIPFSQIFDGTFKNNSAIQENNQITTENLEEQSSQPATSSPNVVSAKSGSVSQHSKQVDAAPTAQVREEKTTASQAEQKAKANSAPEFQGGNYALTSYIAQHIHYPPAAAEKKIQGKVVVKLTISSTGQVSNAEIVQSVDPMLDAEALRLCKSLPRFTPARRNGQPVASTMSIPINFRL